MTAEERIVLLEEQLKQAVEQVQALQEQLAAAKRRIEELEKQKRPPAAFVKANVVKASDGQKKPRKKRAAQYNRARRREQPTRVVEHGISTCSECGSRLGGVSIARRRQVIDIPPPPAVEVTEHVVYHGWCSQCQKWREAPLQLGAEVIGHGRLGVRISSLIAYLRTVLRVPIRQIQAYLATVHQLRISVGEIVEVLHRLCRQMQPQVEALKTAIRASPAVQADETGWREDGQNGYIWSVSTPQVRYYEYHHSRGREVVEHVLGKDFEGVLGSDFYAAYNVYTGPHQRCWVHLLGDCHDLKEHHPADAEVQQWAKDVKAVYERAVAYPGPAPGLPAAKQEAERRKQQHAFEQELWQVCAPYAHTASPVHTLCERIERYLPELFVFVARPEVPPDNNLAERSLRPLVIARKVSGGSRSPTGSDTRMDLFSLFGTWAARGLNPFFQCLAEVSQPYSLR
jgi:transposase